MQISTEQKNDWENFAPNYILHNLPDNIPQVK